MNYLSTTSIAKKWNLSRKTITNLCNEGKIDGAIFVGNRWMIPDTAKKHLDARRRDVRNSIVEENDNDSFVFPIYLYNDFYDIKQRLKTKDELDLYKAQELYNNLELDKSFIAHKNLLKKTSDIYIKIACLYMLCLLTRSLGNFKKHMSYQKQLKDCFNNDFMYKKEMELLLYEAESFYKGNEGLLNNTIDYSYNYSSQVYPLLVVENAYRSLYLSLSNEKMIDINLLELSTKGLYTNKSYLLLVRTHLFLAMIHKIQKDDDKFDYHVIEAYKIGLEHNVLYGFSLAYVTSSKLIDKALETFGVSLPEEIKNYSKTQNKNQTALLKHLSKSANAFDFNKEDAHFISLASSGHTNKEIAKIMNISESSVANHFNKLYNQFGVNNKKELVKELLNTINKY